MIFYRVENHITNVPDYVQTIDEAVHKFAENSAAILMRESYRFSIAHVIVEGNNTMWRNTNESEDPEVGQYQVFNHNTGLHEHFESLTQAIARREQIKQEFVDELFPSKWVEVDEREIPHQLVNPLNIPIAIL